MIKKDAISHLNALHSLCGWWGNGNVTESIKSTSKSISDQKFVKLETISEPFFIAHTTNSHKFRKVILDFFKDLFSNSYIFPSLKLTIKALKVILNIKDITQTDEYIDTCQVLTCIFNSPSGYYYIHGSPLSEVIKFLLILFDASIGTPTEEVCKDTIQTIFKKVITDLQKEVVLPLFQGPKMANFITHYVTQNALLIHETFPNTNNHETLFDVDIVWLINTITNLYESSKLNPKTISIICYILITILESKSPIFESTIFKKLLNENIHLIMISISLNLSNILVEQFAQILLIIYKRFIFIYQQGFYEIFQNGLLISLSSPNQTQIKNSCKVFKLISTQPQLYIDLFVNYDCDSSGKYLSVFENIIKGIAKHAYPDDIVLHYSALISLQSIINSLWKYLYKYYNVKDSEVSTENLIKAKLQKDKFLQGIDLFKRSPKKGLQFFIDNKFVEEKNIAKFLFNTPQLDPTSVGEIIGTNGNSEILKEYVSCFDFRNKPFEVAFREFLSKFRIPGEAQMIDRIMEQFGAKYYDDNPSLFTTADVVYVLAFSALMLHTDAHHPHLKNRMTLEEFINNNKGINNNSDLPRELLTSLYNGITSKRIYLTTQDSDPSLLTVQQRAELYQQKCTQILSNAKKHNQGTDQITFQRIISSNIISPMFQTIWSYLFAIFTISFDSFDNENVIKVCLNGLSSLTNIAAHCYYQDILEMLINSFTKFTKLRTYSFEQFKPKNIQCISSLIKVATINREFLRTSWTILMNEISAIDKLKCFEIPDILFTGSSTLDRESIKDFVIAICTASSHEIKEDPPRMYMLLKLLDVLYFNMDRPKFIWNEIWSTIGDYLIQTGSSENLPLAKTTVNVIWQITCKFIAKPEIESYHFQENFLRSFFDIYLAQNSMDIKGIILECVERLIKDFSESLHSGWSAILQILTTSAIDFRPYGFSLISLIIRQHLNVLTNPQISHLSTVLISYVKGNNIKISLSAIMKFKIIAAYISKQEKSNEINQLWGCIFASLQQCIRHNNENVQKRTILTIVEILKNENIQDELIQKILSEDSVVKRVYKSITNETPIEKYEDIVNDIFAKNKKSK